MGFETADDCCVYALPSGEKICQTVDFFTPVVDDPFTYGRIAAANALSDIYAMGGEPLLALSLVSWPLAQLPKPALKAMLDGVADACREAAIPVGGGHSIDGAEPLCGLAVTGRIAPGRLWRNVGARPGDALLLTKPLGAGIATALMKKERCPAPLAEAAIASMSALNAAAARAAAGLGDAIHAVTDVTGFGLVGHASEMCAPAAPGGPGVSLELEFAALPRLPGIDEILAAAAAYHTGGAKRTLAAFGAGIDFGPAGERERELLLDPQTSGGLLIAVDPARADELTFALRGAGCASVARIGRFVPRADCLLRVV